MDWKDVPLEPCPVGSALGLFGDRWSMLIIRDVMNGVRRFDELVDRLGVSRATLSDRLGRLVEAGLIEPSDYTDSRGRVRAEYRLTPKGWDLRFVLIALREWGDRHVMGAGENRFGWWSVSRATTCGWRWSMPSPTRWSTRGACS